ncbi:MAG: flagellar hook assembly protein FlgD [Aquaspirillum sp.]
MSTVNSTSAADPYANINGTAATGKKSEIEEAQDRFWKLLVTQLQTQDPLNPLDNEAITSQMAQISTVQGIEKLNKTMEDMATMYATAQSLSAANMVGRSALVGGSGLTLAEGGTARAALNLPQGADTVAISVYNAKGDKVDTIELGKQKEGVMEFEWDGKNSAGEALPAGAYSFSVSAKTGGNVAVAQPLAYQRINAVSWAQGAAQLHLPDGTRVGLTDIYQLGV